MIGDGLQTVQVSATRAAGIGRRKPKRCFAEAAKFQERHDHVTLVHALIQTPDMHPFLHAWCELPEGVVFDALTAASTTLPNTARTRHPYGRRDTAAPRPSRE